MAGIPNWARFDEVADSYDKYFLTSREPARQLANFMKVKRGADVLEIGCGTGFATFLVADAVGKDGTILATDIAENMIEVGRTKARNEGIPNIRFQTADGSDLDELDDESFDYVFANAALMGFPDVAGALKEWARVARPGGTVAFSSFSLDNVHPLAVNPNALDVFRRYVDDLPRLNLPTNDIDTAEKCATQLSEVGLTGVEVQQLDLGYYYRNFDEFWNEWWSSLFRLRLQVLDPKDLRLMRKDLSASMQEAFVGDGFYRPNITLLAKARR